jgi:hypothetical protein
MSDRLRSAIARALDESSQDEHERENERHQAICDQERAEDAKRRERELVALERVSYSIQQLAEAVSRISVSGIHVHNSR